MRSANRPDTGTFFGSSADMGFFVSGGIAGSASDNAPYEALTIKSNGNVGIGTSSPATKLEISGVKNTSYLRLSSTTNDTSWSNGDEIGALQFYSADTSGPGAGVKASIALVNGTVSETSGAFLNMVFRTPEGPSVGLNNVERMRIDYSGNLGLGVTPSSWSTASTGRAIEVGSAGSLSARGTTTVEVAGNAYYNGTNWIYRNSNSASNYTQSAGIHSWNTAASGTAGNAITFTQAMTLDASGRLLIGATSGSQDIVVSRGSGAAAYLGLYGNGSASGLLVGQDTAGLARIFQAGANPITFWTNSSERMRIDSSGNLLVGKTAIDTAAAGGEVRATGFAAFTRSADTVLLVNRLTNDGVLVSLRQASTEEGNISVSGTTVSYNGGHLARWSQLFDNSKDESILKGTVLSNLDEMCVWEKDGVVAANEQLNKMKVSDVEGDTNVAGVFVNWTRDEDYNSDDMNIAMTGDMIIRIAQGVTVQRGDLLMSAGDGTAKPQGDDIVRSKTIAKVTSTNITCTYADGSYCVPCVLMAC
jgi:hypothetical protein